MKRLLLAATLLAAGNAWAGAPNANPKLYEKACASCHGAAGKGGSAPAIAGKKPGDVAKVVSSHAPPMDKMDLTPDEIAGIARYLGSLKK